MFFLSEKLLTSLSDISELPFSGNKYLAGYEWLVAKIIFSTSGGLDEALFWMRIDVHTFVTQTQREARRITTMYELTTIFPRNAGHQIRVKFVVSSMAAYVRSLTCFEITICWDRNACLQATLGIQGLFSAPQLKIKGFRFNLLHKLEQMPKD